MEVMEGEETMMLDLECWSDDLSPEQEAAYKKLQDEHQAVKEKLEEVIGSEKCRVLFEGTFFKAVEVDGYVADLPTATRPSLISETPAKRPIRRREASGQSFQKRKAIIIDDDDDDDLPLKRPARSTPTLKKEKEVKTTTPTHSIIPTLSAIKLDSKETSRKSKSSKGSKDDKLPEPLYRPTENLAYGGLTVGEPIKPPPVGGPDSKEITFNKIQGKTYPSLVVIARPSLKVNTFTSTNRSELDSKVKVVLILTPGKFTEWLIQQGLLKSEQRCLLHNKNDLKLGVYSDGAKFPYSGGYVWISECRPVRFISVFNGSLFEGAQHPPSCILKLIYHWSCQTSIQNIIQWVKIDNLYIKTVYNYLRAICTVAIHQHLKPMGGPGRHIEVGVISLGTTTQDGQQRQVKVEVLGVFNPSDKSIRLRAIEPLNESERSYKKRFAKILEPLSEWIVKDSIITIDLTVDKSVLYAMGFKNVLQVSATDKHVKNSNAHVMDYLRRIVPRMFQNTLSLLTREMIQQFLDELVWREQFGTTPLETFNNITKHIAEQTRMDAGENLISRLNKVSTNPFINWGHLVHTEIPRRGRKPNAAPKEPPATKPISAPVKKEIRTPIAGQSEPRRKQLMKVRNEPEILRTKSPDVDKTSESVLFEETFYGTLTGLTAKNQNYPVVSAFTAHCRDCKKTFDSNVKFQKDILNHIVADTEGNTLQCDYCLDKFMLDEKMKRHCEFLHPLTTKNLMSPTFNCVICELRFNSVQILSSHMQKTHCGKEMPYKCGVCDYRSSSRRNLITHFYETHNNVEVVQCVFCLLTFQINAKEAPLEEAINIFIGHMQNHFVKGQGKRCPKCSLTFLTKGSLKTHLLFDHKSFLGRRGVKPLIANSVYISMPKLKSGITKDSLFYKVIKDFTGVTPCPMPGKMCLECDTSFEEQHHLIGFLKCPKCRYQTCCVRAMLEHTMSCQPGVNPESNVHIDLDKEVHCVCGFSSSDGNSMARHLAVCDHKSAYPSVEVAQENTVKRNMLDMLGLIRRSGDSDENNEQSKESVDQSKESSEQSKEINEPATKTSEESKEINEPSKETNDQSKEINDQPMESIDESTETIDESKESNDMSKENNDQSKEN